MMTTTLRALFMGTLAIVALSSSFFMGGLHRADASSVHKPNLVIASASTKPNRPGAANCGFSGTRSGPATATIVVKNLDPLASSSATEMFFNGRNYLESLDIVSSVPALPAGGQATITFAISECHLNGFFLVDFNDVVAESNENDNMFTFMLF